MTLVKAAHSPSPSSQTFVFEPQERSADAETTSQPIAAKTAVGAAPTQDKSLAKEAHFLDRIAALEKALAEKDEAINLAKTQSYDEGLKAGEEAAAATSEKTLELLKISLESEAKTLKERLEGQVDISVEMARTILSRILGDSDALPSHVARTAQHWKQRLSDSSILRVRVSADDFEDQAALDALEESLPNIEIVPQLDLKPGACVFDLKPGTLDASIDHQRAQADSFLAQATERLDTL